MLIRYFVLLLVFSTLSVQVTLSQESTVGPYFGLPSPGLEKKPFNPTIPALEGQTVSSIHFTPDGQECYLRTQMGDTDEVFLSKKEGGIWQPIKAVTFADGKTGIAGFSPDSNRLYFVDKSGAYIRTRTAAGWSAAQRLSTPVNSEEGRVIGLSVGAHEDLYFCSWRPPTQGACDVWRARYVDGDFPATEILTVLNSPTSECQVICGPDDSYLIFYSWRPGGFGRADLYVTYRSGDTWTHPRNLGPKVNSNQGEVPQTISPDGKYLFFYSNGQLYWIETSTVLSVSDGVLPKESIAYKCCQDDND